MDKFELEKGLGNSGCLRQYFVLPVATMGSPAGAAVMDNTVQPNKKEERRKEGRKEGRKRDKTRAGKVDGQEEGEGSSDVVGNQVQ